MLGWVYRINRARNSLEVHMITRCVTPTCTRTADPVIVMNKLRDPSFEFRPKQAIEFYSHCVLLLSFLDTEIILKGKMYVAPEALRAPEEFLNLYRLLRRPRARWIQYVTGSEKK